ncbi:MAG: hypothetical protein IKM91_01200 [Candidatus Methanomethylophilaceae archaeon]|nr:hypothetical protein [Candidatus Methanomethylophilaceae archaeon]
MARIRKPFGQWCETHRPDLLESWHPALNSPVNPSGIGLSHKGKVWWVCDKGHEWQATVQSRMKSGCPVCSNHQVCPGVNDLATTYPEIAAEWHPTMNGELTPRGVIAGSTRKVWWLCPKGHAYDAGLNDRKRGNGCPYCAGKRPIAGETDLATTRPNLAVQWHPTRNGGSRPRDFTAGSGKKAWWVCDKGHEWQAVISSRAAGNGCPYCGSQLLLPGFNDLATVRPDMAAQWHPTKNGAVKPSDVFPSTGKKYWWICENGHEWQSSPNNRMKVFNCPYCSGHHPVPGETDFATLHPDLMMEWHPTRNGTADPGVLSPGSAYKAWWVCPEGHEWQTTVSARVSGVPCPYCSGRRLVRGRNDLATVYPEIAKEWHPTLNGDLTPRDVKPGSVRRIWWMCEKGHEWQAKLVDRSTSRGCPFCAMGRQASFNEKAILVCLQKTFPEIDFESNYTRFKKRGVSELDIYVPSLGLAIEYDGPRHTNYARDNAKSEACRKLGIRLYRIKEHLRKGDESLFDDVFMWVSDHAQGKEMNEVINTLEKEIATAAGIGCWTSHADLYRYRSEINEILIVHPEKSLAEMYPEVAKQWHPTRNGSLLPKEVYAGSNRKAWWVCEKGHEWEAVISSRSRTGCPYCSNRRVIPGENDLATTNPELISEWHPTRNGNRKPSDVVSGSQKKAWWACERGHEWEATINDRVHGRGCPYCSSKRLLRGFNDLQTVNPKLAAEWHPTRNGDLKPSDVFSTVIRKAWWVCDRGHEWEASIGTRNTKGNGCPYCSGYYAIPGETDLATVKPELAREWHPTRNGDLKPSDVTPGCHLEIWWMCERGHEWTKRPHGRGRCPYCSDRAVLKGYNDLASRHPAIASQWHPTRNGDLSPENVLHSSKELFWWRCGNGHEWRSTIADRARSNGMCIECFSSF